MNRAFGIAWKLKTSQTTSQPYRSVCSRATARRVLLRPSWRHIFSPHPRQPGIKYWDSNKKGFRALRLCPSKFKSHKVSSFRRRLPDGLNSCVYPPDAEKAQDKINGMIGSFSFCAGPFWFVKRSRPFPIALDVIFRVSYCCSSWQNSDFTSLYGNLSTRKNGYQLVCIPYLVLSILNFKNTTSRERSKGSAQKEASKRAHLSGKSQISRILCYGFEVWLLQEWKEAAITLDKYLNFEEWKKVDEDPFYDWMLVRKVRRSLKTVREKNDVRGCLGVLETCMRSNFAAVESPRSAS